MAIWKYQTATCEPKDLQMSLDEMAKMGWEVITVLVQQTDITHPSASGHTGVANKHNNHADVVVEREIVTEYRIIAKQQVALNTPDI